MDIKKINSEVDPRQGTLGKASTYKSEKLSLLCAIVSFFMVTSDLIPAEFGTKRSI